MKRIVSIIIAGVMVMAFSGCQEEEVPNNLYSEVVTAIPETSAQTEAAETSAEETQTQFTVYTETKPEQTHIYYDVPPNQTTVTTQYVPGAYAAGYDEQKFLEDAPIWYMSAFNMYKYIIKGGVEVDKEDKITLDGWAYIKVTQEGISSKQNLIDLFNEVFYNNETSELDVIYKDYDSCVWRINSLKASTLEVTNVVANSIVNSTYNSVTFSMTISFQEEEKTAEKNYDLSMYYDGEDWKVESFTYPSF